MKTLWLVNGLVALALLIAAATLDAVLQLGDFHGLVVALYGAYAAGALLIVNLGLALWRKERHFAYAGLVCGAALFLLAWGLGSVWQYL